MSAAATTFTPVQAPIVSAQGTVSAPMDGSALPRPVLSNSYAATSTANQVYQGPMTTTVHSTPSYVNTVTPYQVTSTTTTTTPYRVPSGTMIASAPVSVTTGVAPSAGARQVSTTQISTYQGSTTTPMTTTFQPTPAGFTNTTYHALPGTASTILQPGTSFPQTSFPLQGHQGVSTTSSLTGAEHAIQAAISQGRVYAPTGSVFVPGALATRSGMATIYDASVVPTFETALVFQSAIQPGRSRGVSESEHQESKIVKALKAQKKSACC